MTGLLSNIRGIYKIPWAYITFITLAFSLMSVLGGIYIYIYIITYFTFLSSQKNSHLLVMSGICSKILGTSVLAPDCVVSNQIQRPTDCSVPETTPN